MHNKPLKPTAELQKLKLPARFSHDFNKETCLLCEWKVKVWHSVDLPEQGLSRAVGRMWFDGKAEGMGHISDRRCLRSWVKLTILPQVPHHEFFKIIMWSLQRITNTVYCTQLAQLHQINWYLDSVTVYQWKFFMEYYYTARQNAWFWLASPDICMFFIPR